MWLVRNLLDKMKGRFTKVPEHNPTYGVFSLIVTLMAVSPLFLLRNILTDSHLHQLHLAAGLGVLLEAALYLLPDNQRRNKVALRVAQVTWGLFVIAPLIWMVFGEVFSNSNH
jgi:NADH:ubiquinone oxidoreductase subunit 6 (subunit J)